MSKTIIIAAMPEELAVLEKRFDTEKVEWNGWEYQVSDKYIFVLSGIGNINSAMCTEAVVSFCNVQKIEIKEVLNFGLAGAFDTEYPIGSFIPIKSVIHYDFDVSALSKDEIHRNDIADEGFICASGDKFLINRPKYCEDAALCDMELAGIAGVCAFHNVKLQSIKVVSDVVGDSDQAEEFRSSKRELESAEIDDLISAFCLDNERKVY